MRAQFVNEKFTEDSDPIHDLGIGMDALIKRWIENETSYSYNKEKLLWICAENGKTEFVKYLLNKGYDVHANDDLALRLASENGHTETVKVLLDAGADVHAYNDQPLRWASDNGHTETIKVLLDAGADVHARDDLALRWASENKHAETVKVLKDWIAKEKKVVNEKFTEDSDPIADLRVGGIVLDKFLNQRRKKLGEEKEKLNKKADKDWESYLRKILIGKTITAEMDKLSTFDKKSMQQIGKSERGKFTIKIVDIKVDNLENPWNDYIIVASENKLVYKLNMTKKIYIR